MFFNLIFLILILLTFNLETLSFLGLGKVFKRNFVLKNNKSDSDGISTYPIHDIYNCARLSELAYEFDYVFHDKVNYLSCVNTYNIRCPDFKFIKFIKNKTNLHCLITRNDVEKKVIVVFKGTNRLINWFYNIKIGKVNINDENYVHKGFYLQVLDENIVGQIQEVMDEIPEDYDWLFCGHSAGGAHSILTSYILANKFPNKKIKTFTFALPRVGNKNFAESFENLDNIEHYRTTFRNDIFTALPLFRYHHFGHSLRLYPKKLYCGDYNKLFTYSLFKCNSIFDHHPKMYVREMEKLIPIHHE